MFSGYFLSGVNRSAKSKSEIKKGDGAEKTIKNHLELKHEMFENLQNCFHCKYQIGCYKHGIPLFRKSRKHPYGQISWSYFCRQKAIIYLSFEIFILCAFPFTVNSNKQLLVVMFFCFLLSSIKPEPYQIAFETPPTTQTISEQELCVGRGLFGDYLRCGRKLESSLVRLKFWLTGAKKCILGNTGE